MILNHVTHGSALVIITTPAAYSQIFGNSDLNTRNVMPIPYGFENRIGKPLHKEALDGFLAQVVIYAKNLRLLKSPVDHLIKFMSACQIPPERFFNNYLRRSILALVSLGQATGAKIFQDRHEDAGRR